VTLANYNKGMSSKSARNSKAATPIQQNRAQEAEKKPAPVQATTTTTNDKKKEVVEEVRNYANRPGLNPDTIRENMKKAFDCNPYLKPDDEAEYYETIRRLDECGTCWAGQQKYYTSPFKLMQKGPGATLYQKDFVKHPIEKAPKIKNDFYGTFNIEEPIDFGTTMQQDYKAWKPEKTQPFNTEKGLTSGIPFAGRSGYKAEYIDWGRMPVDYEKAPNSKTVISELPFVGKSAYQENFGHNPTDPAQPMKKTDNRSPLSPGIPFLGRTTHNSTYKPYKVQGAPMFSPQEEYEPTEAYPNQYNTLYRQDYAKPNQHKCPAKIYMETHTHPKYKTLKM